MATMTTQQLTRFTDLMARAQSAIDDAQKFAAETNDFTQLDAVRTLKTAFLQFYSDSGMGQQGV